MPSWRSRSSAAAGLVQYHPHIAESARILLEDLERYPELSDAREQLCIDAQDFSNREELERADLVISIAVSQRGLVPLLVLNSIEDQGDSFWD